MTGARLLVAVLALTGCAAREKGPGVAGARGNEPFWAISIEGRDAVVRTPDHPDGVKYKDGRWTDAPGSPRRWVYRARRSDADGLQLALEVSESPCTDSMSGNAFPFTAAITFSGVRMEGCAS